MTLWTEFWDCVLSPETIAHLEEHQWATVADVFHPTQSCASAEKIGRGILDECRRLKPLMMPNRTKFGELYFDKPDVYDYIVTDEAAAFSGFKSGRRCIVDILNRRLDRDDLSMGTLKVLRLNGEGGCIPLHYDNSGPPLERAITLLLYCVEDKGAAGTIKLQPFLMPPVEIPVTHGRFVMFYSDRMLHEVPPTFKERYSVTLWLDGATNKPEDCELKDSDLVKDAQFFAQSPLQRVIARPLYRNAFQDSLDDMFESGPFDGKLYKAMVKAHGDACKMDPRIERLIERLKESAQF